MISRTLSSILEAGDARQKQVKKGGLHIKNEHSARVLNFAVAMVMVFQRPAGVR